jgi:hypothetical protein
MTSACREVVTIQDNAGRQQMRAKGKYIKSLKVYLLVVMTSEHSRMNTYVSCGLPQCRFHVGMNVFIWLHNEAFIHALRAPNRYGKGNNDI